ncbi:MAG: GNAT family N-acetyltransferase [Proteobacteria bacterium]|nr:GNAT family N-acetyltransferase [Pseudomonadota bacterium]
MKLAKRITGKTVNLRSMEESDAEFVLGLRLNPELNRFINPTDPSVDKQKDWIDRTLAKQDDYPMMIETNDGRPLGTIAAYNIDKSRSQFEWGRWVIDPTAPPFTPVESAGLIYHFGFFTLDLDFAILGVQQENTSVRRFHENFGCQKIDSDDTAVWYGLTKERFRDILANGLFRNYLAFMRGA